MPIKTEEAYTALLNNSNDDDSDVVTQIHVTRGV